MESGNEFLNFCLIIGGHKKDLINIGQFTKFEVLLLDCNHVVGFQKSKELETFVWVGAHHFRILRHLYGIWATFDRSQPSYYAMKHNQTWYT